MARPLHKLGLPGNATTLPKRPYPSVLSTFADGSESRAFGRQGASFMTVIENGPRGRKGFDSVGGPVSRLSAYIHDLRHIGINISRELKRNVAGYHVVYVLENRMTIVKVDEGVRDE